MSARQPFLPSRPASRAVSSGEETSPAPSKAAHVVSNDNISSNAEKTHLGLGGTTRALNITNFKKSAPRTTSFGTTADPGIARNQNEVPSGGMLARSGSKGSTMRIYAPRPYTPPTALLQGPITESSGSEFKKPSLPFSNSKSIDEAAVGPGSIENIARHSASNSDAAVSDSFRSMAFRPQDEMGAAPAHRPSSRPSFFGNAQFPFDNVASNQDDSGYYSSVSEQTENEGDRLSILANRSDAIRPAASGNEVQATRSLNVRAALNPDFDLNFANPTKRTRPASPADRDGVILPTRSHELSKRPCIRRSPLRSHGSVSQTPLFENVSPGPGGTQAFVLPPNVPHPSENMGGFPGLEFSEADLGRYAELYEKGIERWSRATMEEWLSGGNDIMAKFTEMVDMIKEHMSSKMNLFKSLHTKLTDEHTSLEQRARELRDASHTLVRDSGSIGGGLDSNNLDAPPY